MHLLQMNKITYSVKEKNSVVENAELNPSLIEWAEGGMLAKSLFTEAPSKWVDYKNIMFI